MAKQVVNVSVLADTKKFSRAMKNLGNETGMTKLAAGFKKASKVVAAGMAVAGAGAAALAVKATAAASNLEQSMGGVDAVFKGQADTIHAWAKSAAGDLGLSQNSYNEFATVVGSQLKNMGIAQDQVTGQTNDLIKKGADLAAQFGGSTSDAVSALSALMRGEADPIERYGVSIKDADIKARMAADGTDKLTGAQGKAARTQAILALLNKQTADAQGAFARESNTLAGQQERLKAKFENIVATLGQYFIPVATKVTAWISDRMGPAFEKTTAWINDNVVPAFRALGDWFTSNQPALEAFGQKVLEIGQTAFSILVTALQQVVAGLTAAGQWIKSNTEWLIPLATVITSMVVAYQSYVKVMAIWSAITKAAAATQALFNVALTANPIGLIITAVAGLVAGLTLFFTKTEVGRQIWDKVWTGIQAGFDAFVNWIKPILADISSAWAVTWERMKAIWSVIGPPLIAAIRNHIEAMKNVFSTVFNVIKVVVSTAFNQIKTIIQTTMGVVQGVIKTFTSLIKGDWEGAWNGIKQIFTSFTSGITNIAKNAATGMLGAGKAIIDGLWNGIKSGFGKVQDGLNWLTSKLPDWKGPKQKDKKLLTPAGKTIILGFVKGLESGYDGVKKSLKKFTDTLGKIPASKLTKGQNAQLKATKTWAKSMSKTTKGIWDDGKYKGSVGRWSGLNSGTTNLLRSLTASGNWRKTAKGAYQKVASKTIKSATLADIGKAQDGVQKLLEKAKASLAELKKARADMKAQIADSIKSELDITSGMTTGSGHFLTGQAGFKAVAGSVKTMAAKAKKFAGKLKSLVAKGIPAGLVQEVAGLGTEKGMQVADALLAGTSAQVKELKADYSSLGSWSKKAGDYVAGQMYDTGIQAQNGLIKGLESDAAKLTKAAEKLAGKLVKAVKKALGIKSPSRVFKALGVYTVQGMQQGLESQYRTVENSIQRFAGRVAQTPMEAPVPFTPAKSNNNPSRMLTDADIQALAAVLENRPVQVNSTTEFKLEGRPLAALHTAGAREADRWK